MAIEYPIKKSLGADVHNFPKVQYDKIKEIIDALNTTQEDITELQTPTYTSYVALLTQSGTNAPVATVLENTLGGTVVWSYNAVGSYTATLSGGFPVNSTVMFIQRDIDSYIYSGGDGNTISVITKASGVNDDDQLYGSAIEIRVYN